MKFLLALTDERVARRSAPFDQPEIFVPIDGAAPQNDTGRKQLLQLSDTVDCNMAPATGTDICFQKILATGREGQLTRVPGFLGLTRRLRGVRWPLEYDHPEHPGWLLMKAILTRSVRESPAPAVLCPLPTFDHIQRFLSADAYRARFGELAEELEVPFLDVLPALWARPAAERLGTRFPCDEHPSRLGQRMLADAIAGPLAPMMATARAA